MRKIAITLKIVQIEEKSFFFSHYFFREKARQFVNMTIICIQGLDTFYIPSFASKLLLKEVKSVKNPSKTYFSTESSTYRDFCVYTLVF